MAIAEEHPELETAILFGSFARGDSVPASDIDLLLILAWSDTDFQDRIVAFLPSRFPVGIDVFPYTREEIEKMVGEGNGFISAALREGVKIYARPSS
ncbi:MAG: nucleotidyltransferase domain-containing protein [Actinobacteria bacterium]|nr:nucleotidyltransferase domain-containing protein [Actinomycetota bacterium]